jgi:hypothetical protein
MHGMSGDKILIRNCIGFGYVDRGHNFYNPDLKKEGLSYFE